MEKISYKYKNRFEIINGTWMVYSLTNPKWNCTGKAEGSFSLGGPIEIDNWIMMCKKALGEVPDDLVITFLR